MSLLFALSYATKSIARRPKKNLGAILAVSLGVMLLIGVQVGAAGLEKALAQSWYGSLGEVDVSVHNPIEQYFPANVSDYLENNADLSNVEAVTERIQSEIALYSDKDGQFETGIYAIGLQPDSINQFGGFYDLDGNQLSESLLEDTSAVIVNDVVAEHMGLEVGDTLTTSISNGNGTSIPLHLQIVEIIDNSMGLGTETNWGEDPIVYTNIKTFQQVLIPEMQDYVTHLRFQITGVERSLEALDYDNQYFPGISDVRETLNSIDAALAELDATYQAYSNRVGAAENISAEVGSVEDLLNLFVVMLTSTALLLIVNVQSMALDDRRYQTAVLRAMGSSKRQIFMTFLFESSFVGIAGAVVGSLFGVFYGQYFIQASISDIFGLPPSDQIIVHSAMIINAVIMGVSLAVLTTVIPAWMAASRAVTNELRGIETEKVDQGRSSKAMVFGVVLTLTGLLSAQNVGEFWTKEAWASFDNQVNIMLGLGLTIAGIGLLLSYVINRRLALNISGLAFYGLSIFVLFVAIDWIKEGNGNTWLSIQLLFIVVGMLILVVVNFDLIMKLINKVLFLFAGARPVSQVSTTSMTGKKGRLTMVFAIFTIVLIMTVFISSTAESIRTSNVDAYAERSHGVDIVVNVGVPSDAITDCIAQIDGVTHVYGFRSVMGPMYFDNPQTSDSFDPIADAGYRRVVEVPEAIINPDNDWSSENALPFSFFFANDKLGYDRQPNMSPEDVNVLSQHILDDFYDNKVVDYDVELTKADGTVETRTEQSQMVIGDFFSWTDVAYWQSNNPENDPVVEAHNAGEAFTMMGDWDFLSGAYMVTPQLASQIALFDQVQESNLFLVKTAAGYNDVEQNRDIAAAIESAINDLSDSSSLSSQAGILIGATTRIVQEEVKAFWLTESSVWDFLATFSTLGLIIAALGMVIIAVRSVAERTREIGMMRAIGFDRASVVYTVGLELLFITLLGLGVGILNGIILTEALTAAIWEVPAQYPWLKLFGYTAAVFSISLIAGIIPGVRASRVPPSEALRYTG